MLCVDNVHIKTVLSVDTIYDYGYVSDFYDILYLTSFNFWNLYHCAF